MSVNFTYALVKTLSSTCPVFRLGRFYSENIQLLNMRSEKCFSFSLNDFEKTFFALSRTIQCSIYENCFSTYLLASAKFNVRMLFWFRDGGQFRFPTLKDNSSISFQLYWLATMLECAVCAAKTMSQQNISLTKLIISDNFLVRRFSAGIS